MIYSIKIMKLIIQIMIIIFLMKTSMITVYCQETLETTNLLETFKSALIIDLELLMSQSEFKMQFSSIFYEKLLSDKKFVEIFVNTLDLLQMIKDNSNLADVRQEILSKFVDYIAQKEKLYSLKILLSFIQSALPNALHLIQDYLALWDCPANMDGVIVTPGARNNAIDNSGQKFIKDGLSLTVTFDDAGITICLSIYGIPLFYKKF